METARGSGQPNSATPGFKPMPRAAAGLSATALKRGPGAGEGPVSDASPHRGRRHQAISIGLRSRQAMRISARTRISGSAWARRKASGCRTLNISLAASTPRASRRALYPHNEEGALALDDRSASSARRRWRPGKPASRSQHRSPCRREKSSRRQIRARNVGRHRPADGGGNLVVRRALSASSRVIAIARRRTYCKRQPSIPGRLQSCACLTFAEPHDASGQPCAALDREGAEIWRAARRRGRADERGGPRRSSNPGRLLDGEG